MASVNKVIVLGNLGQEPEVRYTPSGAAVCNISVATTRSWKSRDNGEKQEETEWHRIVFYDRLAEVAGEYLKKGHPVYVEGRLKTRKWQDKDGIDRYTTEIVAESMQLLGGRDGGGRDGGGGRDEPSRERSGRGDAGGQGRGGDGGYGRGGAPARSGGGQRQQPPQRQQQRTGGGSTGFDDMDDDIPF